jgi:hypothetical protein
MTGDKAAISSQLSAVSYQLSAVSYQLSAVSHQAPSATYWSSALSHRVIVGRVITDKVGVAESLSLPMIRVLRSRTKQLSPALQRSVRIV